MKVFQINYKRLVLLILPTFLRQPRIFAFLTAMTFAVDELHSRFVKNREGNLFRLQLNGQVCYLRKLLKEKLDQRIKLSDGDTDGDWVFALNEEEPYQLLIENDGTMVYKDNLIIKNEAYFIVSVPWLESDEDKNNRLRSFLNEYKLLSKKYIIRYEQTKF